MWKQLGVWKTKEKKRLDRLNVQLAAVGRLHLHHQIGAVLLLVQHLPGIL